MRSAISNYPAIGALHLRGLTRGGLQNHNDQHRRPSRVSSKTHQARILHWVPRRGTASSRVPLRQLSSTTSTPWRHRKPRTPFSLTSDKAMMIQPRAPRSLPVSQQSRCEKQRVIMNWSCCIACVLYRSAHRERRHRFLLHIETRCGASTAPLNGSRYCLTTSAILSSTRLPIQPYASPRLPRPWLN